MKSLFALLLTLAPFFCLAAVNVNTATQAELETLKGIGPAKAKAIVDYRSKNGAFKSIDELEKVGGIGKNMLDKLRGELSVSGAGKPAVPAAPAPAKPATKPAK